MSPNQNPDMWRSQGGPANPPNAPKISNGPASGAPEKSGNSPLSGAAKGGDDEGKDAPQGGANIGNASGDSQGAIKGGSPDVPSSGAKPKIAESGAGDPASQAKGASGEKTPQLPASAATPSGLSDISSAKGPASANLADNLSDKSLGYINDKIDSVGSKKPDPLDNPERHAPISSLGRDMEMGKEGVKGAIGGGLKGAAKGALTGGVHGAVAGGVKQGVIDASKRINKTSATQRADQNRGPSNAGSLLDKAGSAAALEKSRMDTSVRLGGGAGGAGGASGVPPAMDISPEDAVEVAKAAATVANRLVIGVSKAVGISILLVISLLLTLITAVTGAITPIAASSAAYSAQSVSCEAPGSTSGAASPGSKGSETGMKPAGIKTMRFVNAQWGGKIGDIGTLRNDQDHATGNALDVMIPAYKSAEGNALGAEIANELQKNADKLGIKYLIWDSKFWNNPGGVSWTYTGTGKTYGPLEWAPYITNASSSDDTQMHRDHVHVSVKDQPGEPLEGAPAVSAASYVQSQLSPSTTGTLSFDRASFTTLLPSENLGHEVTPASLGLVYDESIPNARTIIGMAKTLGFNREGAIIGVMVALGESEMRNLEGGDRDSQGMFQQRPSQDWGTVEEVRNPTYASQAFFLGAGTNKGLKDIASWQILDPWAAGQKVQNSGMDGGVSNYLPRLAVAKRVVDALYDSSSPVAQVAGSKVHTSDASANTDTSESCGSGTNPNGETAVKAGDTYPANKMPYNQSNVIERCGDSVAGGCRGECVDWTAWTLVNRTGTYGTHFVSGFGSGYEWEASAKSRGIPVDMNPVAGDVVFFYPGKGGTIQGSVGHVATVQKVNGNGTIDIEEYNFGGPTDAQGGGRYHTRTIPVNEGSGYIHFFDPSKSDEENKANLIAKKVLSPHKGNWPRAGVPQQ